MTSGVIAWKRAWFIPPVTPTKSSNHQTTQRPATMLLRRRNGPCPFTLLLLLLAHCICIWPASAARDRYARQNNRQRHQDIDRDRDRDRFLYRSSSAQNRQRGGANFALGLGANGVTIPTSLEDKNKNEFVKGKSKCTARIYPSSSSRPSSIKMCLCRSSGWLTGCPYIKRANLSRIWPPYQLVSRVSTVFRVFFFYCSFVPAICCRLSYRCDVFFLFVPCTAL